MSQYSLTTKGTTFHTDTFRVHGDSTFIDGIHVQDAPTSAPTLVTSTLTGFFTANFPRDVPSLGVTFTGCIKTDVATGTSGPSMRLVRLPGALASAGCSAWTPGAGTYAAGRINAVFPTMANPSNPGALPVEWVPGGGGRWGNVWVKDNGVIVMGAFWISPDGKLSFGAGMDASVTPSLLKNFTLNGDNGVYGGTLDFTS